MLTGFIALSPLTLQLFVALSPFILQLQGGKSGAGGAERWGWGLFTWEEGGAAQGCSAGVWDLSAVRRAPTSTPRSQKETFSGPLEAAGMSRRCEQNEDNKQVGLFMCFKYILS